MLFYSDTKELVTSPFSLLSTVQVSNPESSVLGQQFAGGKGVITAWFLCDINIFVSGAIYQLVDLECLVKDSPADPRWAALGIARPGRVNGTWAIVRVQ